MATDALVSLCYILSIALPFVFLVMSLFFGGRSLFGKITFRRFWKGLVLFPLLWTVSIAVQYLLVWIIPEQNRYVFADLLIYVAIIETLLLILGLALYTLAYLVIGVFTRLALIK